MPKETQRAKKNASMTVAYGERPCNFQKHKKTNKMVNHEIARILVTLNRIHSKGRDAGWFPLA
jgi:hypothetical protein